MSEKTIDTLFDEERRFPPSQAFAAQANVHADVYDRDFDEFWESMGRERVSWFEPFSELYRWELPYAQWYLGGTLNVAYNCVDRHVEAGLGDRVAYLWEGEPADDRLEITYGQLQRDVARMANALRQLGVRRAPPSRSTWAWCPSCRWRCSRARVSAPPTQWYSAASRPTRCRIASTTWAARC